MKWYSEKELEKWKGHSITFALLEQMKYVEMKLCVDCEYWTPLTDDTSRGICRIFKDFTDSTRPCRVRSK